MKRYNGYALASDLCMVLMFRIAACDAKQQKFWPGAFICTAIWIVLFALAFMRSLR